LILALQCFLEQRWRRVALERQGQWWCLVAQVCPGRQLYLGPQWCPAQRWCLGRPLNQAAQAFRAHTWGWG